MVKFKLIHMKRVAINGLGRIGRAVFKILEANDAFELVAVNELEDASNHAYLINYDTVYGRYGKKVTIVSGNFETNNHIIKVYNQKDPENLPWKEHEIDIVFDCTGVFRKRDALEKHLRAGARKVILSSPARDDSINTVVLGVNLPDVKEDIHSCASCTTNCITPVVEIVDRHIGIKKAIMTTVHAFTASQNLVDSTSSQFRRGRAASANFVPTTTGAAIATTRVLTQLDKKFNGVAIRGPVTVGSIADITFQTKRDVSEKEVNEILKKEASSDRYAGIFGVTDEPFVSSDIIGDPRASVADLSMTMVVGGDMLKIMSWYDNEWGYANQMVRTAETMGL